MRARDKTLITIAHHTHVVVLRAEHEHHFVLHVIGVLIFVDKDVTEPALVGLENVGMFAEQLHGVRKQVVEVHSAGFEKAGLVVDENLRDLAIEDGAGSCSETGGVETFVLGRGNRTVHRARRELLGIEAEVANAIARETFGIGLVVDRERGWKAKSAAITAQDAHASGVEGRDPHLFGNRTNERGDALFHLASSLIGEGDGQDLEW